MALPAWSGKHLAPTIVVFESSDLATTHSVGSHDAPLHACKSGVKDRLTTDQIEEKNRRRME